MIIYWIPAQAPQRVLALVKHLGLQAEFVEAHRMPGGMKSAEYARLNPNMKAPTLVDGDVVLWEASAIMAYLCIKAGSNMWPAGNPAEQVEVLRWLSWNDCHWSPAVGPFYFEYVVKKTFGLGQPDTKLLEASVAQLLRFAQVLDEHLDARLHVACDRLTIADFQLASMAMYWRDLYMPLVSYPNIIRWLDALQLLPAWSDPWPATGASLAEWGRNSGHPTE